MIVGIQRLDMRPVFHSLVLILLFGGASMAQDPVPPVAISAPVWHVDHRHITAQDNSRTTAQREMTADDKYYAREKRNNSVRGNAPEPSEMTTDGRRQKMDKAEDAANSTGDRDEVGYLYQASFIN